MTVKVIDLRERLRMLRANKTTDKKRREDAELVRVLADKVERGELTATDLLFSSTEDGVDTVTLRLRST